MAKNIETNHLDNTGNYEVLYLKTLAKISMVENDVSNMYGLENGNVNDILSDISDRLYMIKRESEG